MKSYEYGSIMHYQIDVTNWLVLKKLDVFVHKTNWLDLNH